MNAINLVKPVFVTIIPAYAGFFVLSVLTGDDGPDEPIKYPVVAWALEEDTLAPYPITHEGVQYDNHYILQPHGTVERACIDGYPGIDEWFAEQRAAYARQKRGDDGR